MAMETVVLRQDQALEKEKNQTQIMVQEKVNYKHDCVRSHSVNFIDFSLNIQLISKRSVHHASDVFDM